MKDIPPPLGCSFARLTRNDGDVKQFRDPPGKVSSPLDEQRERARQGQRSGELVAQVAHGGVHLDGGPEAQAQAQHQLLAGRHEQLGARQPRRRRRRARARARQPRHQRRHLPLPTHATY